MSPLITAIIMTARVGASFTAVFASMKINEEILALEPMAIHPIGYLGTLRLISRVIMLPCLTAFSYLIGMIGTALAAHLLSESDDGGPDEARKKILEALGLLPAGLFDGNLAFHVLRGDALERLARLAENDVEAAEPLDEARRAYLRALEIEPSDIGTLLALGRLERKLGRLSDAASRFEQVLFIDAESHEGHLLLAEVLEAEGDLEGATLHLWAARTLDHSRPSYLARPDYGPRLVQLYEKLIRLEEE